MWMAGTGGLNASHARIAFASDDISVPLLGLYSFQAASFDLLTSQSQVRKEY